MTTHKIGIFRYLAFSAIFCTSAFANTISMGELAQASKRCEDAFFKSIYHQIVDEHNFVGGDHWEKQPSKPLSSFNTIALDQDTLAIPVGSKFSLYHSSTTGIFKSGCDFTLLTSADGHYFKVTADCGDDFLPGLSISSLNLRSPNQASLPYYAYLREDVVKVSDRLGEHDKSNDRISKVKIIRPKLSGKVQLINGESFLPSNITVDMSSFETCLNEAIENVPSF